jgi:hypothetical protein
MHPEHDQGDGEQRGTGQQDQHRHPDRPGKK